MHVFCAYTCSNRMLDITCRDEKDRYKTSNNRPHPFTSFTDVVGLVHVTGTLSVDTLLATIFSHFNPTEDCLSKVNL